MYSCCGLSVDCSWQQASLPFTMLVQLQLVHDTLFPLMLPVYSVMTWLSLCVCKYMYVCMHCISPCVTWCCVRRFEVQFAANDDENEPETLQVRCCCRCNELPLALSFYSLLPYYDVIVYNCYIQGSAITEPLLIREPHKVSSIPSTSASTPTTTTRTRSCRR